MKKDRTLNSFLVDEIGLSRDRPTEVGDRPADSVTRNWATLSFSSIPHGKRSYYREPDGRIWIEDCPGFLVQEWVSITESWYCPRENPDEVDIRTHTYSVPEDKAGLRRVVPAGFDAGELAPAAECNGMGEYCGQSRPDRPVS